MPSARLSDASVVPAADAGDMGSMSGAHGTCCTVGECLCHGPGPGDPDDDVDAGPFGVDELRLEAGTVYYPVGAEPPLASVAISGGIGSTATVAELRGWARLHASHGIVAVLANTLPSDTPQARAERQLAALAALFEKGEQGDATGGVLEGQLSDRAGVCGYSMGGGGATLAAAFTPTLKTAVALMPWGADGDGVTVPTLLVCGMSDTTAPCSMARAAYDSLPDATPRAILALEHATHFSLFDPRDGLGRDAARYVLAFQKVFLEGDERWRPLLTRIPDAGEWEAQLP